MRQWPVTFSTTAAPTSSAADSYAAVMLIVTGSVQSRPEAIDEVLALSLEHVRRSRAEPGCLLHSVHQDVEDSLRVVFVEHWEDKAALAAHFAVPASGAFVAGLTDERMRPIFRRYLLDTSVVLALAEGPEPAPREVQVRDGFTAGAIFTSESTTPSSGTLRPMAK